MTPDIRNQNNFDFLRVFAALLVIFGHSFQLIKDNALYHSIPFLFFGRTDIGFIGLYIFFIISGYLITKSWISRPDPIRFFKNRILRIFPGLITAVLITVFILGPVLTTIAAADYFRSSETIRYLLNILLLYAGDLPGVFTNNPITIVNMPLWSLPVEFTMYLMIACLGLLHLLHRKEVLLTLFFIIVTVSFVYGDLMSNITLSYSLLDLNNLEIFSLLLLFYLSGSILFLYREKLENRLLVGISVLLVLCFSQTDYYRYILVFSLPIVIISFGMMKTRYLSNISRYGDLSYGLYIYGFLIQQILVQYFPDITPIPLFIGTVIIVVPVAYLSWRFVENPMLQRKNELKPVESAQDAS